MKKILLFATAFVLWVMPAVIVLASNTDNDVVFRQDKYTEYFKVDQKGGRKNYLYTKTEQPAPRPGYCNVYTADSEQAISVVCNMKDQ